MKILALTLFGMLLVASLANEEQATNTPRIEQEVPSGEIPNAGDPSGEVPVVEVPPIDPYAPREAKQAVFSDETDEEKLELMKDWEEHMQGFIPDEMLTFEIDSKVEEIYTEQITQPTNIRGAFFVSYFSDEKIDFMIRDPLKKKILQKINRREAVFTFNVTDPGDYEFVFSNARGKEKKQITFALDVHNTTESHLSLTDLNPVEEKLERISSGIRDFMNEQRFASKRQSSQLEAIQVAHNRLMIFSIVEVIIVAAATSWQVFYIKRILDNKRIV